ncbi:MAG: carboxypeptidase-like regulatory domain-containing protein, partial [Chloroflexota bacterium]
MTKRKFKGLAVALIFASLLVSCGESASSDVISGRVLDESGPVVGATVRIKAAENSVTTDAGGQFFLTGLKPEGMVYVTAWAAGYYIGGAEASPGDDELEIHLHAHTDEDNPDYAWLPSLYHPGQGEDQGCAGCHSMVGSDVDFPLPVDEWLLDAHAGAATNPRFLTMYSGSDVDGNQSPLTRYGYNRDYGSFPIRPDPNQPYYGPGYKLDFPETAGNCAACHTPLAAVNGAYSADPTYLTDIEIEGISCDFCHKIWDIRLDPVTNMPYPNMPGVLSLEFRRPPEGHQFFAGPLDDVAPGEDTYSPIQRES